MRPSKLAGVLLASSILILPASSLAQDNFSGFAASMAMIDMHTNNMNIAMGIDDEDDFSSVPSRPVPVTATTYRPDPAIRRQVESQILQVVSRHNAEAGQQLSAAMAQHDFVAQFDRAMGRFGLRSGNAVDAMTAYILASWGAANNYQGTPTRTQVQAVKDQIGRRFNSAGLNTAPKRQEFAETLIYRTILMDMAMEETQKSGDTATARRLGDQAQRQLLSAGFNLRQLTLTDRGLVPGA